MVCYSKSSKSYPIKWKKKAGLMNERTLTKHMSGISLAVQAHEVIEPVHVYTLWPLKWQSKSPVPYQLKRERENTIIKMSVSLLPWIV